MSMKARHRILGECEITEACILLQERNADSTSTFIEFEGEVLEVSKALLEIVIDTSED